MTNYNERLDVILFDFWARHRHCKDGCQSGDPNSEITKQALYKDMAELIDIPVYDITDAPAEFCAGYNHMAEATRTMQAELRTKLKEYYGVKNEPR